MENPIESNPVLKSQWKILSLAALVVILVIGGLIYFFTRPNEKVSNGWKSYKNSGLELSYPPSITIIPNTVAGGGKSLTFKINDGSNLIFSMQIFPLNILSSEKVVEINRKSNFKESPLTISGKEAFKFTREVDGLKDSVIVFEDKDEVYIVNMDYKIVSAKGDYDKLLLDILATINLTD